MPFHFYREGTFTFEVQQLKLCIEYLSRRLEVETFSGRVVVATHQYIEILLRDGAKVGLAGECSPHAGDGIFDASLLPRGIRIAEVRLDSSLCLEQLMSGKLCAIVKSDRFS